MANKLSPSKDKKVDERLQRLENDLKILLDITKSDPVNVTVVLEDYKHELLSIIESVRSKQEQGFIQNEDWVRMALPSLVDAAMRCRHILRPHVQAVQSFFQSALQLVFLGLSLPPSSLPKNCTVILMDVLLIIMGGAPSINYADTIGQSINRQASITAAPGHQCQIPGTFYREHGKPRVWYRGVKAEYFWEDEDVAQENTAGGGEESRVGWQLEILAPGYTESWKSGTVKEFYSATKEHIIAFDDGTVKKLLLRRFDVRWLRRPGDLMREDSRVGQGPQLTNSQSDLGLRIEIYWRKYDKFFSGTITAFDATTGMHQVTYDDNDRRDYFLEQKDFRILSQSHKPENSEPASVPENAPTSNLPDKDNDELFAPRPSPIQGFTTSTFLIDNINFFHELGGFDALTDRLFSRDCTFKELQGLLKVVFVLRQHLSTSALHSLVWDLKETVPRALIEFPDSQLKEMGREDLSWCVSALVDLVVYCAPNGEHVKAVTDSIARLELDLTFRQFTSTQLEKRLAGLISIKDLIEAIQEKELMKTSQKNIPLILRKKKSPPAWATPEFMVQWLLKSGFINQLFGPAMHVELLKRATPVLRFMASLAAMGTKELEAIWACAAGRHHEATTGCCMISSVIWCQSFTPDPEPCCSALLLPCLFPGTMNRRFTLFTILRYELLKREGPLNECPSLTVAQTQSPPWGLTASLMDLCVSPHLGKGQRTAR